jgi:hypothetical protein
MLYTFRATANHPAVESAGSTHLAFSAAGLQVSHGLFCLGGGIDTVIMAISSISFNGKVLGD